MAKTTKTTATATAAPEAVDAKRKQKIIRTVNRVLKAIAAYQKLTRVKMSAEEREKVTAAVGSQAKTAIESVSRGSATAEGFQL